MLIHNFQILCFLFHIIEFSKVHSKCKCSIHALRQQNVLLKEHLYSLGLKIYIKIVCVQQGTNATSKMPHVTRILPTAVSHNTQAALPKHSHSVSAQDESLPAEVWVLTQTSWKALRMANVPISDFVLKKNAFLKQKQFICC